MLIHLILCSGGMLGENTKALSLIQDTTLCPGWPGGAISLLNMSHTTLICTILLRETSLQLFKFLNAATSLRLNFVLLSLALNLLNNIRG